MNSTSALITATDLLGPAPASSTAPSIISNSASASNALVPSPSSASTAAAAAPPRIAETSFYPWWFHYFSWTYAGCFIAFIVGCYVTVWWKIRVADREADERELEEKRERVARLMARLDEDDDEAAGWSSSADETVTSGESGPDTADGERTSNTPLNQLNMQSARWPTPFAALRRAAAPSGRLSSSPHFFAKSGSPLHHSSRNVCSTTTRTQTHGATNFLRSYRLAVALALPVGALTLGAVGGSAPHKSALQCASAERAYATGPPVASDPTDLTEAESILNVRDLGFGTVSGICVGVFVKKGLRAIAFALGGVFVLLQYLSSRNFVTVDWGAISRTYDSNVTSRFGPTAAKGGNRVQGVWAWFLDFVGANIQSRATFVLGVMLGLRLG